jgi:hypothetical protein
MPKISIAIPSGGLVVDKPAEFIDSRSISNCQNIEIKRSIVQKRAGTDALGATMGERIQNAAELESGIQTFFVRVGPTKVETIDKGTLIWTSIANTALSGAEVDQVNFAFPLISAVKFMVFTNGVNNIRKWNGTSTDADLGGSPPKCRFIIDFKGYLFLAYVTDSGTDYPSRVQWSDTADPEEWDPLTSNAGAVDLLEDSLPITGISRFGDYVAVHKESAIYLGQLLTTSEVFRFTRKETGSGTIAQGSIQNLPDGTQIFLARDGLRIFNGITSTLIQSSITDELRDSISPQWGYRATSVLVKDLDEYWVGIPTGSQEDPETIYKYNYRTGNVYTDERVGLTCMALYRNVGGDSWDSDASPGDTDTTTWNSVVDLALFKAIVFSNGDGISTIRSSSSNDVDEAIDTIWDTKDFTAADIDETKDLGNLMRWKGLDLWMKGGSVTVYYSIDSGESWINLGSQTLTSSYPLDDTQNIFYFDVVSSKIRFRFRNNTVSETWAMKMFVLNYSTREARK